MVVIPDWQSWQPSSSQTFATTSILIRLCDYAEFAFYLSSQIHHDIVFYRREADMYIFNTIAFTNVFTQGLRGFSVCSLHALSAWVLSGSLPQPKDMSLWRTDALVTLRWKLGANVSSNTLFYMWAGHLSTVHLFSAILADFHNKAHKCGCVIIGSLA